LNVQHRLSHWVEGVTRQVELPLRLELWNGQAIDFSGDAPRVTIRLPKASAARYLLTPSLSNLGTAYVEGAIEVKGAASDMIAVVNALARSSLQPDGKLARIARTFTHDRHRDAE
jgi:cyclopropane-fatty-acyl-phospholipid synthase